MKLILYQHISQQGKNSESMEAPTMIFQLNGRGVLCTSLWGGLTSRKAQRTPPVDKTRPAAHADLDPPVLPEVLERLQPLLFDLGVEFPTEKQSSTKSAEQIGKSVAAPRQPIRTTSRTVQGRMMASKPVSFGPGENMMCFFEKWQNAGASAVHL